MESGFIKIARKLISSPIMDKPAEYYKAWTYLIMKASFTDTERFKKGEGFVTINEIREFLSYYKGYAKITPSTKQVWGIIEWLRSPHEGDNEGNTKGSMIVTTKVTHGMLYKVVNYSLYQSSEYYEGNSEGNNEGIAKVMRRAEKGNNNYKKEKNKEEEYNTIGNVNNNISSLRHEVELTDIVTTNNKDSKPERNTIYSEVYNHYMALDIIKHKGLTDAMKKAIDKAMRECKYTVEDMKKLLDRHKAKVESTKSDGQYAVKPRTLHEFFGQRVSGGVHLICQDYEDGAKYGDAVKEEQPKKRVVKFIEIERSRDKPDRVIGETVREI